MKYSSLEKHKESDPKSRKTYTFLYVFYGVALGVLITLFGNMIFCYQSGVHSFVGSTRHSWPDPPPHSEVAKVARYVLHISEWGSLSTISTHQDIEGYPFGTVFSVSDGAMKNSTGIPYFYLTELQLSVEDFQKDPRASFTISESQSDYCKRMNYDPEDPRCAHVIFTGKVMKIEKGSKEEMIAKAALFARHPEMPNWPSDHNWFFAKLNITHIYVMDYFGGARVVDVEEYFESTPYKL